MTISSWLIKSTNILADLMMSTPRLDAEIILAHTLRKPRAWLHAHVDDSLDQRYVEIADARLELRVNHVPIAYIIGHKEFYGRRFLVNTNTLIPRPETEQVIEQLLKILPQKDANKTLKLVDIGTGSGCLGITAKLEWPRLDVTLCDISKPALEIASKNSKLLNADIVCLESNLLNNYPHSPDIVLANLPYVDKSWDISKDTSHEPDLALFANNNGLALIKKCFDMLSHRLPVGGIAIFEADPRQWDTILPYAKKSGFEVAATREYAVSFVKTN